jgi:hypothetical protein
MSVEQMRKALTCAYPGADWPFKVQKMSDKQVAAVYYRLLAQKKL